MVTWLTRLLSRCCRRWRDDPERWYTDDPNSEVS